MQFHGGFAISASSPKKSMKLRSTFPYQQLLFLAFGGLSSIGNFAHGQTQAAFLKMKAGDPKQGVITQVSASGVAVQMSTGGSITIPLAQIESVQVAPPPEYNLAMQAIAQKDIAKAVNAINAVVGKYKGLPADWAQQATALAGFLALQNGETGKAESAFAELKKFYPAAVEGRIGTAAIAASKKDFATAKTLIAPIVEDALKQKDVPLASRFAYSRAIFISGQVKESEKDLPGALEDYLRTTTIFYHDASAVAAAQERADALRKNKIAVP